jgi:NAD(P)-dependent dehydrogenase (short-subunit alcohol dehydrogenase family)
MRPLAEQVVVITGASSGIGLCTARHLAARGARVVVTARNAGALERLVREIEATGGHALAVPAEVTSEEELRAVAEQAVERFGRIDTWINNAAVFIQGEVEDITREEFRRVIDVNLLGYINGSKHALEQMKRQGYGGIIQISSILGDRAAAFFSAYAASKAGIDGFSESLRVELWGKADIHISTLYLPPVDTPIYQHARGKFGTIPKPPPLIVDPQGVAEEIGKLAEKPRVTTAYGEMAPLFWVLGFLPHHLADWIFHRMADFTKTDIPDRGDNLDAPLPGEPQVRGGWMQWGWRGLKASEVVRILPWEAAIGTALLGLLTAGAVRRLRGSR